MTGTMKIFPAAFDQKGRKPETHIIRFITKPNFYHLSNIPQALYAFTDTYYHL